MLMQPHLKCIYIPDFLLLIIIFFKIYDNQKSSRKGVNPQESLQRILRCPGAVARNDAAEEYENFGLVQTADETNGPRCTGNEIKDRNASSLYADVRQGKPGSDGPRAERQHNQYADLEGDSCSTGHSLFVENHEVIDSQ